MLETLNNIDIQLFHLINHTNCFFLDWLMTFVTELHNWRLIIILSVSALIIRGKKKERLVVLGLLFMILITDQLSSSGLKFIFKRIRPCNVLDNINLLVGCSGSFSFPSSHATNISGAMSYLSFKYPKLAPAFIFSALLVGYSRIYVGVHYPFHVLAGWIIGALCALLVVGVEKQIRRRIDHERHEKIRKNTENMYK